MVEDILRRPAVVNSPAPVLARLTRAPYAGLRLKGIMGGIILNGAPLDSEPGCLAPPGMARLAFPPRPDRIADAIIRRYAA
jgi:hypothetical protein